MVANEWPKLTGNKYLTKMEAQGALNISLGFCPVIRGKCKQDCVCFGKGRVTETLQTKPVSSMIGPDDRWVFTAEHAWCGYVLVNGFISVE